MFLHKLPRNVVMDSEITLRMENWRGGDWDETQNGAHVMRRKGCAMQNKGITLIAISIKLDTQHSWKTGL